MSAVELGRLTPRMQELRSTQRALMPALIVFSMGQTVLFAIAGPVVRDIGLSEFQFGIIVSAAALVFVVGAPAWGRYSDQVGRKTVILTGLAVYCVASLAFVLILDIGRTGAFTTNFIFVSLFAIRVLYAVFGSGVQPSSIALIADVSNGEDRTSAIASVGAAMGIGMLLGPASAALFGYWGALTAIYVVAGLGLLVTASTAYTLREPRSVLSVDTPSNRDVPWSCIVPIVLMAMLLFSAASAIQQTLAFNLQDTLGIGTKSAARATGMCFLTMALATLLIQGGILQRVALAPKLMLMIGVPIAVLGGLFYAAAANYSAFLLASAILGIGMGFVHPALIAATSLAVGHDQQGTAAGVIQSMIAMGFVVGPLMGTGLYSFDPSWTNAYIFMNLLLLVPCFLLVYNTLERRAHMSD